MDDRNAQFQADVEKSVCKQINKLTHNAHGVRFKPFNLSPKNIRQRNATKPFVLARQLTFWLLLYHPAANVFGAGFSSMGLGREYARDHTTVLYAVNKAIPGYVLQKAAHPYAVVLQAVCDDLAEDWGACCVWRLYEVEHPSITLEQVIAAAIELEKEKRAEVASLRIIRRAAQFEKRDRQIAELRYKWNLPTMEIAERFSLAPSTINKIASKNRPKTGVHSGA